MGMGKGIQSRVTLMIIMMCFHDRGNFGHHVGNGPSMVLESVARSKGVDHVADLEGVGTCLDRQTRD